MVSGVSTAGRNPILRLVVKGNLADFKTKPPAPRVPDPVLEVLPPSMHGTRADESDRTGPDRVSKYTSRTDAVERQCGREAGLPAAPAERAPGPQDSTAERASNDSALIREAPER